MPKHTYCVNLQASKKIVHHFLEFSGFSYMPADWILADFFTKLTETLVDIAGPKDR